MKSRLFVTIFILSYCCVFRVTAQTLKPEVIASAGSYFQVASVGNLSWTIGEISIETVKTPTASLTQGFQQYFFKLVPIKEVIGVIVTIYPNPTTGKILVETENKTINHYQLMDITGRLLKSDFLENKTTEIDLTTLPESSYLLQLLDSKRQIKSSYKVIKVH